MNALDRLARRFLTPRYSAEEIIELRKHVWALSGSGWYGAAVDPQKIESQLRTYMDNGTRPSELKPLAEAHSKKEAEAWLAAQELRKKTFREERL